jgi:hypothetical protein
MRQKESDVPASVCSVNAAMWVSKQYLAKLKRWARRDWILLLYQEIHHQEGCTPRSAVLLLVVSSRGQVGVK